jgi:choline transport protein
VYVVEVRTICPPKNEVDERLTQINSYVLNVGLGIAMLITMLFCIGSLDSVLSSPAPYLQLFNNTGKTSISLLLNIILFLLIFSGNITALATCSREVWAFARDKGFPFSKWISHVSMSRFT